MNESVHDDGKPALQQNARVKTDSGKEYIIITDLPLPEDAVGPIVRLGKGEFGTVSIAIDTEELTPSAVKLVTVSKDHAECARLVAEIYKEVSIMRRLGRQCDVIQTETENEHHFQIIQPFVKGIPLKKLFEQLNEESKLPKNKSTVAQLKLLQRAVSAFIAAVKATQAVHEKGVVQGDLHAGNILIDPESNEATVIDFGMSHVIPDGDEKLYVEGETPMAGYHRAPETVSPKQHRRNSPEERVYYKSSDSFSLGVNCGVESEFTEHYAPDFAAREVAQLMNVFKLMTQEKMLGGNNNPEDRIDLDEALLRLNAIQEQIRVRILQKEVFELPNQAIQALAQKHQQTSAIRNEFQKLGLPEDLKKNIRELAQQMQQRRQSEENRLANSNNADKENNPANPEQSNLENGKRKSMLHQRKVTDNNFRSISSEAHPSKNRKRR